MREQVWKLIDAAAELTGVGYGMVFMDAFTGLRRNEILALPFTDIDWLNREVAVNKAISKFPAEDGTHKWVWRIGAPKSPKSNRRVALPHSVIELLSGLRPDGRLMAMLAGRKKPFGSNLVAKPAKAGSKARPN